MAILRARDGVNPLDAVQAVTNLDTVRAMRAEAASVHLDEEIYRYIVALIAATRGHPSLALGASPRASVTMMRLSQAYAYIRGRDYVLPDDVALLYRPAVGHRLVLKQEARLNRVSTDALLGELLRQTAVPLPR